MLYVYKVSAPANTTYENRVVKELTVRKGIITSIKILIPAGHHSLAHLVLLHGDTNIAPEHGVEGIYGDDTVLEIIPMLEIRADEDKLRAEVWNDDDTFNHEFVLYIEIKPKWQVYTMEPVIKILESLKNLLRARRIS